MKIHLLFFLVFCHFSLFAQLPSLPIDFEPSTINYQFIDFGGVFTNGIVANPGSSPQNMSTQVLSVTKTNGAETWGGMLMNLSLPIDFSNGTILEMNVWSPRPNVPILLKIEDTTSPPDANGNPSVFAEVQVSTISGNSWEMFDFDMALSSNFSTSINYDRVVLFPDFGNTGLGETFYFDNIGYESPNPPPPVDTGCPDTINLVTYTHAIDSTVHAEHVVISSGSISSSSLNVIYYAGSEICLDPGFEVQSGNEFLADIVNCCVNKTWYEDVDNDGFGNPYNTIVSCTQPAGYSEFSIDNTGYITSDSYAGYNLVWSDEFDNNALDLSVWNHNLGDGCPNVCGWGNNEAIWYQTQNATVYDDFLTIEAREESAGGYNYTSSRIKTQGTQSFQYGRIDIRAKLPYSQGVWPALWMLGDNITTVGWPACGEIDIMELIGNQPATTHGTGHWDNNGHNYTGGSYTLANGIFNDQFHVFSIIWDATQIRFLVDDSQYYVLNITDPNMTEFHNPFFFIFNVSVGGNWPGYPDGTTVMPQKMVVDYVRVFQ